MVMAKVTEILVRVTFGEHYYKWGSRLKKQRKGGAIGLHGTGSVARTMMDIWIERYGVLLGEHGVSVHLLQKYVDDVLVVCSNLPLGSRWKGGRITQEDVDRRQDEESGRSKQ